MSKHEDTFQGRSDKAAEDRGDKHDQFESGSAQGSGRGSQVHGRQQVTNQPGFGAGAAAIRAAAAGSASSRSAPPASIV